MLIEPDGKTLLAFGYDAETKYAKLAAANKHRNHYYFKRFKMLLHGNKVKYYKYLSCVYGVDRKICYEGH